MKTNRIIERLRKALVVLLTVAMVSSQSPIAYAAEMSVQEPAARSEETVKPQDEATTQSATQGPNGGQTASAQDVAPTATSSSQDASQGATVSESEPVVDVQPVATTPIEQTTGNTEADTVDIALSFKHAYITYMEQTLAPPATKITVPKSQALRFSAAADEGYELSKVEYAAAGGKTELTATNGEYVVDTKNLVAGAKITVTAAAKSDAAATEQQTQDITTIADETKTEFDFENADVKVVAKVEANAGIPADAKLEVKQVTPQSTDYNYNAYMDALNKDASEQGKHTEQNTLLYDVAFIVEKDGKKVEVEPADGKVKVQFEFKKQQLTQNLDAKAQEVEVTHLPLVDQAKDAADTTAEATNINANDVVVENMGGGEVKATGDNALEIKTDSFSVFAISYTVDFHGAESWANYSLAGQSSILLSELLPKVAIWDSVGNVATVAFSKPECLSVTKEGNDWRLTSLKPFNSEEELTVTMKDGRVFHIRVTDPQTTTYTVTANFYDYDGTGSANYSGGDLYVYAEITNKQTNEIVGWNAKKLEGISGKSSGSVTFDRFKGVSGNDYYNEVLALDSNTHEVTYVRLYSEYPEYNKVHELNNQTKPNDTIDGFKFVHSGDQQVIKLKKWNRSKMKVELDFVNGFTTPISQDYNYWVRGDLLHTSGGHTYFAKKLNITDVQNGKVVIDVDKWYDQNNAEDRSGFTGNEVSVAVTFVKAKAGVGEGEIRKLNLDQCVPVANGGNVAEYSVAYASATQTDGSVAVREISVDDEQLHETDGVYKINLTHMDFDANLSPVDVLGEASEFGVVAGIYEQEGHTETNFAAKQFKNNGVDLSIEGSGDGAAPMYVGELLDNTNIRIGQDNKVPIDLYITDAEKGRVTLDQGSPFAPQIIVQSKDAINGYIDSLLNAGASVSAGMAGKTTIKPSMSQNNKVIDTTDLPDNITIYVDTTNIGSYIANSGDWRIKKRPNQYIVFNMTEPNSGDKVQISKFYVDPGDGKGEVGSTTSAKNGDDAGNKRVDEVILQHICFNITTSTNVNLVNASALFLAPNAQTITQENGAGYILTKGKVHSTSEWHYYVHNRVYKAKGDFTLQGVKKIVDGTGAEQAYVNKNYQFKLYARDANGNPTGNALDTVWANPASGITGFKSLKYTEADVPKGKTRTFQYVICEVVPDTATNPAGKKYKDATDAEKAQYNFTRDGITYTQRPVLVDVEATNNRPDNADGVIDIAVKVNSNAVTGTDKVFEIGNLLNKKEDQGTAHVDLSAKKTLNGRNMVNDEFQAMLEQTDEHWNVLTGDAAYSQTKNFKAASNGVANTVAFDRISYNEPGTYYYKITEPAGSLANVTYDNTVYHVAVTVAEQGPRLVVTEKTIKKVANGAETAVTDIAFVNTYTKTDTEADIKVSKNLVGRGWKQGEKFKFRLTPVDGAPMPNNQAFVDVEAADANPISFGNISYDTAGEYKYKVSEVRRDGDAADLTYDTAEHEVTVSVTDNAGTLNATVNYGGNAQQVVITNQRTATGQVVLEAHKTLRGRPLNAGEFTFTLKNAAGQVIEQKTNDANGNVTFTAINYSLDDLKNVNGTYDASREFAYTITEEATNLAHVTNDANNVKTVKVTLSDTEDRTGTTLTTTKNYGKDATGADLTKAEFVNTYADDASVTFEAMKELKGATLTANAYTFLLKDSSGNIVDTKTNDADGKVTFKELTYDQDDLKKEDGTYEKSKTFTYTISEQVPAGVDAAHKTAGAITYDTDIETVTVTVTRGDDGEITATKSENAASIKFENEYKATGSVELKAAKKLQGRSQTDKQFTFVLKDAAGKELGTKTVTGAGEVTFDAIAYKLEDLGGAQSKNFEYTISEQKGNEKGYTYDEHVAKVTVVVADNGSGRLTATESYTYENDAQAVANENANTFINRYAAQGNIQLKAHKVLNGRKLENGQFEFTLKGDNVDQTKKNDANGNVTFDQIAYTQDDMAGATVNKDGKLQKTFTYTVSEKGTSGNGYEHATAPQTVTVTVVDNGDGTLTATSDVKDATVQFVNNYTALGSAELQVNKQLTGRNLAKDAFTFELKSGDTKLQEAFNAADGTVRFNIAYTQADMADATKNAEGKYEKTFTYTIAEKNLGQSGYTYDSHMVKATVKVTDNGDGTMTASDPIYEGEKTFKNNYNAEGTVTLHANKTLTGRTLENEQFEFVVKNEAGTEVARAKNNAQGSVDFELPYTMEDLKNADGKTYATSKKLHYTIEEVQGNNEAYDYAANKAKVTVTITDNGQGTITTSATYDEANPATFINTFDATGKVDFVAHKTLNGRTLEADEFTFTLTGEGQNQVKTNAADGKVTFDTITYNRSIFDDATKVQTNAQGERYRTFTYTITEQVPTENKLAGVTYATNQEQRVVTVTDKGTKNLDVQVDKPADNISFTNTFEATGGVDLGAHKNLNGRNLEENQFTFELLDSYNAETGEGNVIQSAQNNGNGDVSFTRLEFNQDTLKDGNAYVQSKTFTYYIREKVQDAAGYTRDAKVVPVTVTVTNDKDETLEVTATPDKAGITFVNTYTLQGASASLEVNKKLTGRDLTAGAFTFELTGGNVKSAITASNDADGKVRFADIAYTQEDMADATKNADGKYEKTFTYFIAEKNLGQPGYTYDNHTVKATVKVTDNGDGTMTVSEPTYEGDRTFKNAYAANGSVTLHATKQITGRNGSDKEFTFDLKNEKGEVIDTKSVAGEGTVTFETIAYSQADMAGAGKNASGQDEKTFTYTISERDSAQPGYTYDKHVAKATVVVTDKGGSLEAKETYAYENAEQAVDGVAANTFVNEYKAENVTHLDGIKTLSNHAFKGDTFAFDIKATGDNAAKAPLPEQTSVSISPNAQDDANYAFAFGDMKFDQSHAGETFTYAVTERDVDASTGITKDSATHIATIKVTDNNDGTLTLEKEYQDGKSLVFANTYKAEGDYQLTASKMLNGRNFKSGDRWTFTVTQPEGQSAPMPAKTQVVIEPTEGNTAALDFGSIHYTTADAGKEYTYVITETGTVDGVTNSAAKTVKVKVTDNNNGTLTAAADPNDEQRTFVNTYDAQGTTVLQAKKHLDGRGWASNETFTFKLYDKDGTELGKAIATTQDQAVSFDKTLEFGLADAGKTFDYTIREEVPQGVQDNGLTYDKTEYQAHVKVVDNGNGTLKTETTYTDTKGKLIADPVATDANGNTTTECPTFKNTYQATGETTLEGLKKIENREFGKDDEYTFTVTSDDEGAPMPENATVTIKPREGTQADINFGVISYTLDNAGKTYTYTVTETGEVAGVTNDALVHKVQVSVSDNGDGTLKIEKKYLVGDDEADVLGFTNKYNAEGTYHLEATKKMQNRSFGDYDEYTFTVTPDDANAPAFANPTVTIAPREGESTQVNFGDAKLELKHRDKAYTYTVREAGTVAGVTNDIRTHKVTVKVTDDGKGNLTAEEHFELDGKQVGGLADAMTFENTYDAKGKTTLQIKKELEGKRLEAGEFHFLVKRNDTQWQVNATNDADGNVVIAAEDGTYQPIELEYRLADAGKTFNYTVTELTSDNKAYTFDKTEHKVKVEVTDNKNGTLACTPIYDDDIAAKGITFKNKYFKATGTVNAAKHLYAQQGANGNYSFTLTAVNADWQPRGDAVVAQTGAQIEDLGQAFETTVHNGAFDQTGTASINLPEITYYQPGEYHYLLKEVPTEGIAYDEATYRVTVRVDGSDQQPAVTYQLVYGDVVTNAASADFYNNGNIMFRSMGLSAQNAADETASAEPMVGKVLEDGTLTKDQFTFQLSDANGNVIQTAQNDETGKVAFERMKFAKEGTYEYKITEVAGTDFAITYDNSTITYTVKVTKDNAGKLQVNETYTDNDGKTTTDPKFVNQYRAIRIHACKRSREAPYDPLQGSTYGIWMANPDGNDVYMGNDISDEGGNLYYNVPTTEGYAYYLLEEAAPHGHLVDPYPTDYFTIAKNDKGYYLVYQNEPEFFKLVPYLEGKI